MRRTETPRPEGIVRFAMRAAWICLTAAIIAGCAPDLQENAGPRVPLPNVVGRVTMAGAPIADRKVKLIDTAADTETDSDRSNAEGRFAFSGIPPGAWTLEASGAGETEFDAVVIDFDIAFEGDTFTAPDLDLDLRGLEPVAPQPGDTIPVPSLSSPLDFEWNRPDTTEATMQVRVYGPSGEAVWYSIETEASGVRWNGIANRGDAAGRPVGAGVYAWRFREEPEDAGGIERSTAVWRLTIVGTRR